MKTIVLCPIGTDLASRQSAAVLRSSIEAVVAKGDKVLLDLSHVETASESYADELFGILAFNYGLQGFSNFIALTGANPSVLRRVAGAIKERLASDELQGTLHILVAAKHAASGCKTTSGCR